MEIFAIFISAIFVNNIVLAQYLGNCPYLGCSKEKSVALGMGGAVIFVIIVSTFCTWLMQRYVLDPYDLGYLQTIVFIVVIAALVQFVEMFLKKAAALRGLGHFSAADHHQLRGYGRGHPGAARRFRPVGIRDLGRCLQCGLYAGPAAHGRYS